MYNLIKILFAFLMISVPAGIKGEIYIPKNMENCIVTIEDCVVDSSGLRFIPHGTGFICGDSTGSCYIITNRHVLYNRDSLIVRFNKFDSTSNSFTGCRVAARLKVNGVKAWLAYPDSDIDLAIVLTPPGLSVPYIDFARLKRFDDVKLGDEVIYLGFPFPADVQGMDKNYPLARSGIVAYKTVYDLEDPGSKYIFLPKQHILIDGIIMSGNSGFPVLSTPGHGNEKVSLIGVLSSHLTSKEYAETIVAKAPNLKFDLLQDKDYRLGVCIPLDRIIELMEFYKQYIAILNKAILKNTQ
jgi:hypothetical protein